MEGRVYEDRRGWRFQVMPGLGERQYKARYLKPGRKDWHCVATLPWRVSPERAQEDLDAYAASHHMRKAET